MLFIFSFMFISLTEHDKKYLVSIPDWFWMMFYSKERNIIGFLAYSNIPMEQEVPADEDFEGFIRYEFSNYDWDT